MVSGSPSFLGDSPEKAIPLYTYAEILDKAFPYYLSIGMTADQYWDGDSDLKKPFREAYKMKLREQNLTQWLQGRYIYAALCSVSPLFNSLSKKHEPLPYVKEPYPILAEDIKKKEEERKRMEYEKALANMKARTLAWNSKYKKRKLNGGQTDG